MVVIRASFVFRSVKQAGDLPEVSVSPFCRDFYRRIKEAEAMIGSVYPRVDNERAGKLVPGRTPVQDHKLPPADGTGAPVTYPLPKRRGFGFFGFPMDDFGPKAENAFLLMPTKMQSIIASD